MEKKAEFCPKIPHAHFSYIQRFDIYSFRQYDVCGNHPLNGSTVGVQTLVDEKILIPDLSPEEIRAEYFKEMKFLKEPIV